MRPNLPEGYVARYEHRRWAVLATKGFRYGELLNGEGDTPDLDLFSEPQLMNRFQLDLAKQAGYTVSILPKGGVTVCRVYARTDDESEADELLFYTETECGNGDSYNKRIGRDISLGLALKKFPSEVT